jgi:cytoskeletal protein RodZ
MSHPGPSDELLERYAQAKAIVPDGLPDQPSAALHERIMHAAREEINAINSIAYYADSIRPIGLNGLKDSASNALPAPRAANDSVWNIKLVASLATMGLSGLLWWQFEHGTAQEQEAAKNARPHVTATATAAATAAAPPEAAAAPAASASPTYESASSPAILATPPVVSPPNKTRLAVPKAAPREAPIVAAERAAPIPASPTPPPPQPAPVEKALADSSSSPTAHRPEATISSQRPAITFQDASAAKASPPAQAARAAAPRLYAPAAAPLPAPASASAPLLQKLTPSPSPLFSAIEAKDASALRQALAESASLNARSPQGNPALTQAVIQRWPEGVRILLAAGADRSAKNLRSLTAADVAQELGDLEIIELLKAAR